MWGSLRTWGWFTLILACLQILLAVGVMLASQLARWLAVGVVGLNAIDQMFFIGASSCAAPALRGLATERRLPGIASHRGPVEGGHREEYSWR